MLLSDIKTCTTGSRLVPTEIQTLFLRGYAMGNCLVKGSERPKQAQFKPCDSFVRQNNTSVMDLEDGGYP